MADRLDIVAVWVEHEGGVVVRVVDRSQPWPAVVLAAGRDRRDVERVTDVPGGGGEGDVDAGVRGVTLADPEERPAL